MTLTLKVRNMAQLDNGQPTEFVLHKRGAIIGRSPTCDWSLPDPRNYISSRHCEVVFQGDHYELKDISTNGTFLNGCPDRMPPVWRIGHGDVFAIGQYEVVAQLSGEAAAAVEREAEAQAAAQQSNWSGWDAQAASAGAAAPPPPPSADGWGSAPAAPAPAPSASWGAVPTGGAATGGADLSDGWGAPAGAAPAAPAGGGWGSPPPAAQGGGWQPRVGPSLARTDGPPPPSPTAGLGGWAPARAPEAAPVASAWEAQIAPAQAASDWSSAAPDRPAAARPDDVWGKIAEGNVVDWARGGFGQPVEAPRDPLGLSKPAPQAALPAATPQIARLNPDDGWGAPAPAAAPAPVAAPPPPVPAAAPAVAGSPGAGFAAFVAAAGLSAEQIKAAPPEAMERAGRLFRRLVAGLVVMVEARARAKSQMGAEATSLEFDGNNPIKFARTPEQAIAQLLNPPERGFMDSDRAIEDAFFDLQSHQMATLKAMQGALKAALDRFSPTAISARAESKGVMQRILPGARDAALWQAYEKEFSGVAKGSDEAFMDVFAKEFRKAYEEQSRQRKR